MTVGNTCVQQKTNKTYIIDTNSYIVIEKFVNNVALTNEQKVFLRTIKAIDKREHFISGMLVCIEGFKSKEETDIQKQHTFIRVSEVFNLFFKKAFTDANSLKKISFDVYGTRLGYHEDQYRENAKFRNFLYEKIHNRPKNFMIRKIECEIKEYAEINSINMNSTMYICAISALYKYENSRKILKLNENDCKNFEYNALSDIYFVERFAFCSNLLCQKLGFYVAPLTFDRALANIICLINTKCIREFLFKDVYNIVFKSSPSEILFPEMDEEERVQLCREITSYTVTV